MFELLTFRDLVSCMLMHMLHGNRMEDLKEAVTVDIQELKPVVRTSWDGVIITLEGNPIVPTQFCASTPAGPLPVEDHCKSVFPGFAS